MVLGLFTPIIFLSLLKLKILINYWHIFRCYGQQWEGCQRHRKSRPRQYNNTRNYNTCSNSTDINNHEQTQVSNNEGVHNSEAQDALNSMPVIDVLNEEPIIIVADTSISTTINDRTPLL